MSRPLLLGIFRCFMKVWQSRFTEAGASKCSGSVWKGGMPVGGYFLRVWRGRGSTSLFPRSPALLRAAGAGGHELFASCEESAVMSHAFSSWATSSILPYPTRPHPR